MFRSDYDFIFFYSVLLLFEDLPKIYSGYLDQPAIAFQEQESTFLMRPLPDVWNWYALVVHSPD